LRGCRDDANSSKNNNQSYYCSMKNGLLESRKNLSIPSDETDPAETSKAPATGTRGRYRGATGALQGRYRGGRGAPKELGRRG
jgi:hypothetical protein